MTEHNCSLPKRPSRTGDRSKAGIAASAGRPPLPRFADIAAYVDPSKRARKRARGLQHDPCKKAA